MRIDLDIAGLCFGCWHRHLSFPITLKRGQRYSAAERQTGTYVVCLRCGKQFPYDWNQMCVVPLTLRPKNGQDKLNSERRGARLLGEGILHEIAHFLKSGRASGA